MDRSKNLVSAVSPAHRSGLAVVTENLPGWRQGRAAAPRTLPNISRCILLDERRVEGQPLLPTVRVPLDRVGDPEEERHLYGLDSTSIPDEHVVALNQRFGSSQ